MTRYFLGVDTGNSKSHALIADEDGNVLGLGKGGQGNHESLGFDGFSEVLHQVTNEAVASAGIRKDKITAMGFGLAGYDWPCDRDPLIKVIESLQIPVPFELVNDAVIGLIAGSSAGWGISLVAGTGNNCRGRDQHGREGRMAGIGSWADEHGGGAELVTRAIQAVCKSWTRRGPDTLLTKKFLDYLGAPDTISLIEGLSRGRYHLDHSAALLVFETANEGDEVAQNILRWMGQQLGDMALGVIRQLEFENLEFEIVLTGSLYKGSPLIAENIAETVHTIAPGANLVPLNAPPVVGGVLLAMEQIHADFRKIRPRVIAGAKRLLGEDGLTDDSLNAD
jgi:N-acetylglucosamine kinase-like BadF-type ATPase